MCFYHGDYDWVARFFKTEDRVSDGTVMCDECCQRICAGQLYEHTDQQEHEECRRCEDSFSSRYEPGNEKCDRGEHDYGETYQHHVCEQCQKMLTAVQRVEEDAGCIGAETRPGLGGLFEGVRESDHREEYFDRARADHPDLALSGYLDTIYRDCREHELFFWEQWGDGDIGPTDELGGEG